MDEANRTLFVGNLETRVTEGILYELFLQAGPLFRVAIAKDKEGKPKQFAFITFKHEESVPYSLNLLNGIRLYGRPLKLQFRTGKSRSNMTLSCSGRLCVVDCLIGYYRGSTIAFELCSLGLIPELTLNCRIGASQAGFPAPPWSSALGADGQ
uniref:RNA binding motif protein 11 n=1 Tax=Eptatretus burgeri TaxID=7764 RepID=A0A8C4QHA1_EPTBU